MKTANNAAPAAEPIVEPRELQPIKTSIVEYSPTAATIAELQQRFAGVIYDLTKPEDRAVAIKARADLRTLRVGLEKIRTDLKEPVLERGRKIDSEAAELKAAIESVEDPIDQQIKKDEQRRKDEQLAKEKAEAERVARIQARIAEIGELATDCVGKNSGYISDALGEAREIQIGDEFGDFKATAAAAKARAIATLEQLHAGAVAMEEKAERERIAKLEEETRLARERAEFEAQRKAEDERQRAEQARIVAENKRIAEERAKADADERARRERIAADEKAARDKIEADARAAQERIAAEDARAKAAREQEEQAAARARAARAEQELKDRLVREDAERRAREEREAEEARLKADREKVEAAQREVARREAELLDGRGMLTAFNERFGKVKDFAPIVAAIRVYLDAHKEAA